MFVSFFNRFSSYLLALFLYVGIAVFFLFAVIFSKGDVAQGDWLLPLTSKAAISDFSSLQFSWRYSGFGAHSFGSWGFPYFSMLNALFSPLGFFGGAEVKILSVVLIAFSGMAVFALAMSLKLNFSSAFLAGLFFMTTAVVFDWLIFGWIYFLMGYALLPLSILITAKYLKTSDVRYMLANGLIVSVALAQPSFIVIYPVITLIFVLFMSWRNHSLLMKGLFYTMFSLGIWLLTMMRFFVSYAKMGVFAVYNNDLMGAIVAQFSNLEVPSNLLRFWGSTWNYQFETYFPKELVFLSFVPFIVAIMALLLKPHEKKVFFWASLYFFVLFAFIAYVHMTFLVNNVPFGSVFQFPCVFYIPACIGIAILLGYANQALLDFSKKIHKNKKQQLMRISSSLLILLVIVGGGLPFWLGATSGTPIVGPPHKINLYQIPSGYTEWPDAVSASDEYFVLYIPLYANPQIVGSEYFSLPYEGVAERIFTGTNDLPYVSPPNATLLLDQLMAGEPVSEAWGLCSIKYVVIYTDVASTYEIDEILTSLRSQNDLVEVANLTGVVVFDNLYAKPIVYADDAEVFIDIVFHDPTSYYMETNATNPFTIVFNQIYSDDWVAFVNGVKIPKTEHSKDINGFNAWHINSTGSMDIHLYYEPQTLYSICTIISSSVVILIILLIIVLTVYKRKIKHSKNVWRHSFFHHTQITCY
jgi:hypothetical protein